MSRFGVVPAWVCDYQAIPFVEGGRSRAGVDCYGLLYLVLGEQFGVAIPENPAGAWSSSLDRAGRDALARRIESSRAGWRDVPRGAVRPGAALLLRVAGRPLHVGVVVNDRAFLHALPGVGVHPACWDAAEWRNRILGFYEWRGAA